LLGQYVVPTSNQLAHQVKHDKPLLSSAINGYWDKQANRIINIDHANTKGELKNIKVWQLDDTAHIQQVLQADTGSFVSQNTADKTSGWQLQQVKQLTIAADGHSQLTTIPTMTLQLPIEPSAIYLLTRSPDNMSVTELWQHQQLLAKDKRRSLEHEVAFWKKLLSPFAMLSLVLVACSFVFGSLRNQSLGYRIVIALLFGLVFSYLQDLVGFVSLSTGFSPFFMVLLPIIASAALGVYLIKHKN
ncbi:MAG TPA: LPS export ABC transporter permease LptG, partial [Moraxella sp.]|nr:LPS export ABC transporter permease LptG [Moraxella sp.]